MPDLDELLSPGYFTNAVTAYDEATNDWWRAQTGYVETRMQLSQRKADADSIEAEVGANGGFGTWAIDGTNEQKRKAQLATALQNHAGYQDLVREIRELDHDIGIHEADAERAVHQLRGLRARLEWVTAQTNLKAAAAYTAPVLAAPAPARAVYRPRRLNFNTFPPTEEVA